MFKLLLNRAKFHNYYNDDSKFRKIRMEKKISHIAEFRTKMTTMLEVVIVTIMMTKQLKESAMSIMNTRSKCKKSAKSSM